MLCKYNKKEQSKYMCDLYIKVKPLFEYISIFVFCKGNYWTLYGVYAELILASGEDWDKADMRIWDVSLLTQGMIQEARPILIAKVTC